MSNFRSTFYKRYKADVDRRPNLSVRVVDTLSRTALLRVSTFMGAKKYGPFQWTFKRRLKKSFEQIREAGIENLIVDVQNNGGGMVLNAARLLQYWMPKSFTIMKQEHMKQAARAELVTRWNPFSVIDFHIIINPMGMAALPVALITNVSSRIIGWRLKGISIF